MGSRAVMMPARIAILAEEIQSLGLRCHCRTCRALDGMFPEDGYQLALFRVSPEEMRLQLASPTRHAPFMQRHMLIREKC